VEPLPGLDLALGDKAYVDDMRPSGLLHGALRLADHAGPTCSASTRPRPQPCPVSCASSRGRRSGRAAGRPHPQGLARLRSRRRPHSYLGDVLASWSRTTAVTARKAAELVDVEYRVLRTITDPVAALTDDEDAVWELDGNVLSRSAYQRGDVDAALAGSAHVVHEVFQTQRIEHAFLEPESTLVVPDPETAGNFTMYSGGQGVWDDRDQTASVLGVDAQRITTCSSPTAVRSAARRTWRTSPDCARRVPARRTGQVHAVARRNRC